MDLVEFLRTVELFDGLDEAELEKMAAICSERSYQSGDLITRRGDHSDEMYIVTQGFAEVVVEKTREAGSRVVFNLGSGQVIGENALLDFGPRSTTVRAVEDPTLVQVIKREDFERLCEQHPHIGYSVMHNLAIDLSFKLRRRNLSQR